MKRIILALFGAFVWFAAPAQAQSPSVVVFGDSIQSGVADGQSNHFDLHLVQQERNVLFRNLSSPGRALAALNSPWTADTLNQICNIGCNGVIIQAGVNDFGLAIVSWASVSAGMNNVMNWARANGKKVLVLDLIWATQLESAPANHMGYTFGQYRMARAVVCALNADVCYFSGRPPQFDVLTPSLYAASEQASGNHIHPNIAGHRVMADWIKATGASLGFW